MPLNPVDPHPVTPDGRYFVVRGRLWRRSNPDLAPDTRALLVKQLMDARRALRGDRPQADKAAARRAVDDAKVALGERGPVWWTDGAADYNRKMVTNSPYSDWFDAVAPEPEPHVVSALPGAQRRLPRTVARRSAPGAKNAGKQRFAARR